MTPFENVKKNFGFGFMRLPRKGPLIDYDESIKMVDAFMEAGFNYFDTAHGYMEMRSENALKKCLTSRYPRESYILVDKLSDGFFRKESQIRPLVDKQLKNCGVDYFDFYLMHAQNASNFEKYKKCRAYETVLDLIAEGKIKHLGISFHDKAEVLDRILTEYPQVEVVQIQFNYLDYNDNSVEGRKCYEVCRKHNKPVIVMEPVKGGSLVKLPDDAKKILDDLNGGSPASYAIRFAASFEGVFMVLSGMSNMEQMTENISFMKDFKPFSEEEFEAVNKVCKIMNAQNLIPCTACRYCVDGCPKNIPIPEIFAYLNDKKQFKDVNVDLQEIAKASDCIGCGKCETACPQHLEIRKLLKDVEKELGA